MVSQAVRRFARRPTAKAIAIAVWAALVIGAVVAAWQINAVLDLEVGPNRFSIPAWELRNFPSKWLYGFGALFRSHPTIEQENARLVRFFALVSEIDGLEQKTADAQQRGQPVDADVQRQLAADLRERDSIQADVEATIEGRITAAAEQEGIERSFLFIHLIWPPVDFAWTTAPRTLVTSPRNRIALRSTTLLRAGLSLPQVEKIEADTERTPNVSALAFPTSGVGAYPTIVDYDSDYRDAVQLIAHEWTHNYLAFRPLGFNYYKNNDTRTMNETVADLVGTELANDIVARWPIDQPKPAPAAPATPAQPQVDAGQVLRDTRQEVDGLLAAGKVDEAERLMEQRREYLADNGYFLRKLNQAYFAFTNLYAGAAGSPAAVNPIGPKVDELRRRAGSLRRFLEIIGSVTTVRDLDRALAAAGE